MHLRSFLRHLVFWVLLSLGMTAYLRMAYDLDNDVWELMARQLISWVSYAPVSYGAALLCQTLRTRRTGSAISFLLHFSTALLFAVTHVLLVRGLKSAFSFEQSAEILSLRHISWSLLVYGIVVAVFRAILDRKELAEHQKSAIRHERDLSAARLSALEQQVQPHFLFNTLHAIALTCREDPEKAESMTLKLSELLRSVLKNDGRAIITVAEEEKNVAAFIEIQQHRFGEELEIAVDIPGELMEFGIPFFGLQTLVENAFKHGIERSETAHRIQVRGRRHDDRLLFSVEDDGPGFPSDPQATSGVGLTNLRKRLAVLYGQAAVLETGSAALGGARVSLTIPARKPENAK